MNLFKQHLLSVQANPIYLAVINRIQKDKTHLVKMTLSHKFTVGRKSAKHIVVSIANKGRFNYKD